MTQEELTQFLKDNLRVKVSTAFDIYDGTKYIKVYTYLGDELIHTSEDLY